MENPDSAILVYLCMHSLLSYAVRNEFTIPNSILSNSVERKGRRAPKNVTLHEIFSNKSDLPSLVKKFAYDMHNFLNGCLEHLTGMIGKTEA